MSIPGLLFQRSPPGPPPIGQPDSHRKPSEDALFDTPILVIEDEGLIAWMIESVLMEAGFRSITLSADGELALAEARQVHPGLIISDVNLGPGSDGIATVRAIRATAAVPVIFITGYADARMRERLAAELPDAQLLRKPVDGRALIRALMHALGN